MRANINTNHDAVTFPEWPVCALVSIIKLRVAQTLNGIACVCVCVKSYFTCATRCLHCTSNHTDTRTIQNHSISNVRFGFRNGYGTNCNRNAYGWNEIAEQRKLLIYMRSFCKRFSHRFPPSPLSLTLLLRYLLLSLSLSHSPQPIHSI